MNKDNRLIFEAYSVQEEGLKDIIKGAAAAAAIGAGSMTGGSVDAAEAPSAIERPIGQMDPKMEREFVEYIKSAENAGKTGFKNNRWYPHKSFEGGTDTIGYGHKLGSNERYPRGLSQVEVDNLLKRDLLTAENTVRMKIGKEYDKLDMKRKQMLIDFAYNLGPKFAREFPKFTKAVIANDLEGMKKEHKRYSGGKELVRRNKMFEELFLDKRQFMPDETKGKKDSDESTVIVKQGDTFYGIANNLRIKVNDLIKANPGVDPKKLQTGQKLNLP